MPGESPERNWDALLSPPTVGQQIADLRDRRRRKRVMFAARVIAIAILAAATLLWLGLLGRVLEVPWPWSLLAAVVWVALGGAMFFILGFSLHRLGRALLPARYWELDPED